MSHEPHRSGQGLRVAFLTQHGKQLLVRAPLEDALGCQLLHVDGYDTDQLGTFTREIARPGSQREAARRKAQIGMSLADTGVGLGSEGAFIPDPYGGFVAWNQELLLWVDRERGFEVAGYAQGPARNLQRYVKSREELEDFVERSGFPEHHLVLRPDHEDHPDICKGLSDPQALYAAFERARAASHSGGVLVENDLRAFCNPSRQEVIRRAADDLVAKLRSLCPECARPGYGPTRRIAGLPCRVCGAGTHLPIAEVWQCEGCGHEESRAMNAGRWADPGRCDVCNP